MYKVILAHEYRKSLKKIKKSGKYFGIEKKVNKIVGIIASGEKLNKKYQDHKLKGCMSEYRECHIKSNLLLIYKKDNKNLVLLLINVGSHDDLF
ncbi:type II toxin-antitoxin system YafQ family toxin [Patescibacteria group bacterium]|nr:type II toxin-antitoxin system YafQ family toxin [Patescibacteria group bacterium]